jgi:sigma-B regulation protein RsbU (phosphoserine phosphatase)
LKTQEYLTAFLVVISPTYDVYYGNASHQRALVLRNRSRKTETWDTNGLFIGAVNEAINTYEEKRDHLDFGDRILLYTDGVIEARNTGGEEFGTQRLEEVLVRTSDMAIDDVRQAIVDSWTGHTDHSQISDDVSFILLELDPSYSQLIVYRDRGLDLLNKRRPAEAIDEFNKALDINDSVPEIHLSLGRCYILEENYSMAVEHLKKFLKNRESDHVGWYLLGLSYYRQKEYNLAFQAASEASKLKQDYRNALKICALSMKRLGKAAAAAPFWENVLNIDPNDRHAQIELKKIQKA